MKLGLALSGGGFRASFFHIGVLAALAERGVLRHIEVISTVSGGSIIGALYYLHVRNLLEEKPDGDIRDEDYIEKVKMMERDFLAGVQTNIRMRTFLDVSKNMRMFRDDYSRSDRLAEIYEETFYRPVVGMDGPIEMRHLKIQPRLEDGSQDKGFHPGKGNEGRKAKVPILLINATSLNTGHNWRFEASRMGEPPRSGNKAWVADKNMRLCRPDSYDDVTPVQQDFPLGHAVAASACVPGLFHPLAVSDMYEKGIRVQLVDGGVHDNLGIEGLLDRNCTELIISDATGQMADEDDPPTSTFSIPGRTTDILMDRVREEQLLRVMEGGKKFALLHLLKDVPPDHACYITKNNQAADRTACPPPEVRGDTAEFGVNQKMQRLLAHVRTDLDSFTEVEAYSLMADGYRMTGFEATQVDFMGGRGDKKDWEFLRIEPWLRAEPKGSYLRQMEVAHERFFKVFRLWDPRAWAAGSALAAIGLFLVYLLYRFGFFSVTFTLGGLLLLAGLFAIGFASPALSRMFKVLRFLRNPSQIAVHFLTRTLGPIIASLFVRMHLQWFDRWFLDQGKIKKLGAPPE
jgi:NTE family protein